jgi:hypothetical protein
MRGPGAGAPKGVIPWAAGTLRQAAWAPIAVLVGQAVAGKGFDLYARVREFDVPVHLAGGVAIAYFFHVASLRRRRPGAVPPRDALLAGLRPDLRRRLAPGVCRVPVGPLPRLPHADGRPG